MKPPASITASSTSTSTQPESPPTIYGPANKVVPSSAKTLTSTSCVKFPPSLTWKRTD